MPYGEEGRGSLEKLMETKRLQKMKLTSRGKDRSVVKIG